MSSPIIDLSVTLCSRDSITPDDKGCQTIIAEILKQHDFNCQSLNYGQVSNLWATHGSGAPFVLFLGHTDVVPTGNLEAWHNHPFKPEIRNNHLYARGIADMKGCVAASTLAITEYVKQNPDHIGTVAMLLTSDEEGPAIDGIRRVVSDFIEPNNINVDYCVVTEPTCKERLGDTIKIGRRGSLSAYLTIDGIQGHVAYPHLADNPIFKSLQFLQDLRDEVWDHGNQDFEPTTVQISNIQSGVGADNVIPPHIEINFNIRHGTASTPQSIQKSVLKLLQKNAIDEKDYAITWNHSASHYLSDRNGLLVKSCTQAIEKTCQITPHISTSGGTSDGRFIANAFGHTQVLEFGPLNKTIHQINECLSIEDLEKLGEIYFSLVNSIFNDTPNRS